MKITDNPWLARWFDKVVSGGSTMSQRSMSSIQSRGITLDQLRKAAKSRRLSLLVLNDESGRKLVVASTKPFRVIC